MKHIIRNIYKYNDGTDKYCTYLGDSENASKIIVAEVGKVDTTREYIVINNDTEMVMFADKILYINPDDIVSPLYIKGKIVSITALEFHELLKKLCIIVLNKYSEKIVELIDNNYDPINDKILDVSFSEKILRFIIWNDKKKDLKFSNRKGLMNIFKYNVYWAYMGCNIGSEMDKLRPVLIWKEHVNKFNPNENSYYVFPISSKIPKKKYYYNIEIDVCGHKNMIKINDGKRISTKRIIRPLKISKNTTYCISDRTIDEIKNAIKMYFMVK